MAKANSTKKKLLFGSEDQELERDYTINELEATNRDMATSASLLLNVSNEYVEFVDCIEGGDSKLGIEENDVSNMVYSLLPVEELNW